MKQITLVDHPPYSPDLASNDFFLYLKLNEVLKGRHFYDTESIKTNTTAALKAMELQKKSSKISSKGGVGASIGV